MINCCVITDTSAHRETVSWYRHVWVHSVVSAHTLCTLVSMCVLLRLNFVKI